MRIGVLSTAYPRFAGDVAATFVRGMCEALADRGHTLEVFAAADARGIDAEFDGSRDDIAVRRVRYLPRPLRRTFYGAGAPDNLRMPIGWPGALTFAPAQLAAAAYASRRWDAIISHFGLPCGALGAALAARRPHICFWHSADVALADAMPRRAFIERWPHTRHVFSSTRARERLGDVGEVMAMGAEVRRWSRGEARRVLEGHGWSFGADEKLALFVGRLVPIKGLDTWLSLSMPRGLRCIVVGEGPQRARLEGLAGPNVHFLGAVDAATRDLWLGAADFFVYPSGAATRRGREEGAPVAILEAQLVGLPVLASRTGGIGERITDGVDGVLVEPGDSRAWTSAIERAFRGDYDALGARARERTQDLRWSEQVTRIEGWLR